MRQVVRRMVHGVNRTVGAGAGTLLTRDPPPGYDPLALSAVECQHPGRIGPAGFSR